MHRHPLFYLSFAVLHFLTAASPIWTDAFVPNGISYRSMTSWSLPRKNPLFLETSTSDKSPAVTADSLDVSSGSPGTATTVDVPFKKVQRLKSLDAFVELIDQAPKDTLVAVKFYGKSCPLCQRVALKYQKMARYYSLADIQFAEIEKTVHPQLFDTLQITTFPYLQIYRNGQCIASHGTESATMFERIVHDTIQQFLSMSPTHWQSFLTNFQVPIDKATNHFVTMRTIRDKEQSSL